MTMEELSYEEAAAILPQYTPVDPRDARITELEQQLAKLESPAVQRLGMVLACTFIFSIAWALC
jgi:hypothetical protein